MADAISDRVARWASEAQRLGPGDVAVKAARAGSVVVDVEVRVADPRAGAAIASKVADPQTVLADPDTFGEFHRTAESILFV